MFLGARLEATLEAILGEALGSVLKVARRGVPGDGAGFGPFLFGLFFFRTFAGFCPAGAAVVFSAFAFDFWPFLPLDGAAFAVVGEVGEPDLDL